MTAVAKLPLSGYAIGKVYTTTSELVPKQPGAGEPSDPVMRFGWDWWHLEEAAVFEVRIVVGVEPTKEHPYSASVDAIGRFRQTIDRPGILVKEFVKLQAVAILLPYARQFLTNLTVNTLGGAIYLPSVNVAILMADFDPEAATGASQTDTATKALASSPIRKKIGGPTKRAGLAGSSSHHKTRT